MAEHGSGLGTAPARFALFDSRGPTLADEPPIRRGRYLSVPMGLAYSEVIPALAEIAVAARVGVTGLHQMSVREVAENMNLRPREADLVRQREFGELFFFTSASQDGIERFVELGRRRGFTILRAEPSPFWRISHGCDPAKAVRLLTNLFQKALHAKLWTIGVGTSVEDQAWLACVNNSIYPSGDTDWSASVLRAIDKS